ncbi:MAG: arginyltransferase [Rudaea sp.]|nr:arginyltransferase [Rudaea sp.]
MKSEIVRLFQTLPHPCGYFSERTARNLVIDPASPHLAQIYDAALLRGFRRAGGHVYRPQCGSCHACVAARVPVAQFKPDRSQRRCLQHNRDLEMRIEPARHTDEYFNLYQRYLDARHPGGGMDNPEPEDFSRFLYTTWSPTSFIEFRQSGRLLGVAITDIATTGISAVYTFYDPAETARGLGTFAILRQVELARERGLPHLYLGYWIAGHPKMDYKMRFRPLELLAVDGWRQ